MKKGIKILIIVGLLALIGGETIAIMNSQSTAANLIKLGSVITHVEEEFDGIVKKNVSIKNMGECKAYIRVSVTANWINEAGDIVLNPGATVSATPNIFQSNFENDNWFLGSDGYYYYKKLVDPLHTTSILIDRVQCDSNIEGLKLQMDIAGSGIQGSENAVSDCWPAVNVKADRTLERAN